MAGYLLPACFSLLVNIPDDCGMTDNATSIAMLLEKAEDCSKTTVELLKLKAIDKASDVISSAASYIVIFTAALLFFLVINIGIALWIGELCGKFSLGFFITAGFYALVAILLYAFRENGIKTRVRNSIMTRMLK